MGPALQWRGRGSATCTHFCTKLHRSIEAQSCSPTELDKVRKEREYGSRIAQGKCNTRKIGGVSRSSLCLCLTKRFTEAHCSRENMREKRIEEGSGSGSCSLLPLPAKGKVANWEGGGLGEIREKGWHTLKPMQGMMHTTMIIQTILLQSNCSPVIAARRGYIGNQSEASEYFQCSYPCIADELDNSKDYLKIRRQICLHEPG